MSSGFGGINIDGWTRCGCEKCVSARCSADLGWDSDFDAGFRYACEVCGNKRCPHHTDHALACTNSNAPGQKGSSWENYP